MTNTNSAMNIFPILFLLRYFYDCCHKIIFAMPRLFLLHQDIFFYIKNNFTMPRQFMLFSSRCVAESVKIVACGIDLQM